MEAKNSPNQPYTIWKIRKADGLIQSKSEDLRTWGQEHKFQLKGPRNEGPKVYVPV